MRIHTKDFMHLVPKILHPGIEASRYYAENSKSLVIQGDGSRDRTNNVQECYKKLHALIIAAGRSTVRGETSQAQVEKVKTLYVFPDYNLRRKSLADSSAVQAAQRKRQATAV